MSWTQDRDDEYSALAAALLPGLYGVLPADGVAPTARIWSDRRWPRRTPPGRECAGRMTRLPTFTAIMLNAFLSERRRRSSRELPLADPEEHLTEAALLSGDDPTDRLVLLDACAALPMSIAQSWCCVTGRTEASSRQRTVLDLSSPRQSATAACAHSPSCEPPRHHNVDDGGSS